MDNLDIPHTVIVGVPDDSPNHGRLNGHLSSSSSPIPIPRSAKNPLNVSGSLSYASDTSSLLSHPSLTHTAPSSQESFDSIRFDSIRESKATRDNNPDTSVSRSNGHHQKSTECGNSSSRPSPLRSTHSDVTSVTHSQEDTSLDAGSRPSSVTTFFRKTVRVRWSSSPPSGESRETDTGSDTTRNDGQKGNNVDQSTVLDNLEERLEAAKKLRGEAVDLQMLYESGTVAKIKDLRMTGLSRPLPQDNVLFSEADRLLAEIRQLYKKLKMFWKEEIRQVTEDLKKGRTDPRDLERWNTFHSSLKQTIDSWKNWSSILAPLQDQVQVDRVQGVDVDLGEIASSLSRTMSTLRAALEGIFSSESFRYSQLGQASFQPVYLAFEGNSDLCLDILHHCADYGEMFPMGSATSSHVSYDTCSGPGLYLTNRYIEMRE